MTYNKIWRKHFVHPFLFFISLVIVLEWLTTTTAWSYNPQVVNKCIDKERHALLQFKSYSYAWPYEENATSYCCNWVGVNCDNHSGHVTSLDLRFFDLKGKISPSLFNLTYLEYLDLSHNSFGGTIPVCNNLTRLRYLDLSYNYFTGTIPIFIGFMTELTNLYLDLNAFTGTIPPEFGNLTNLQELSLESLSSCTIENVDWLSRMTKLETLSMRGTSLEKTDNWVNAILSLKKLSILDLTRCNLSQVMHPYSYSSTNSSFTSSIAHLYLAENNLNSSMYHWLFALAGNRLEAIDLSGNELDLIPKYFGNLCSLTYFLFNSNSMLVKFPDFLNNLSGCTSATLQRLYASSSQLTGSLSDHIQTFSSLQSLSLSNNQLNEVSEKVWQLPNLQFLDVSSNSIKGAISEYIGSTKIQSVVFSNNPIEGVRSEAHMSNLSYVTDIDLSSCKQGPHFPKWIQTLKALSFIRLANNKISDTIPKEFWNMWPSQLSLLNLSSNNISGMITDLSSNFHSKYYSSLDLSSNNFYGPITNVSSSLSTLDLSKNNFSGEIFFLCQINNMYFSFLDLSHNSFIGQIPDCVWHFKKLTVLSLGHNNLYGKLPASIESLIGLEVLYLYNNSFSGNFLSSLKYCTKLRFLDLGANMFSGYVPIWIGEKLPKLYVLSLTSNNFSGTIPSQLCQLVYLQVLDLSINNLHGAIPSCFNNLTSMVQEGFTIQQNVHHLIFNSTGNTEYVDHAMIKWQGRVREFSSTLEFVKIINLSKNNLTGKIPYELTDVHKLIALDLSMNNLLGEIPPNIGEMKELQILDLSRNNLSGRIPSNMSHMTFLNYLDVSNNNLSGRIPSGTQLQSFKPSRYTGNAGLCGLPLSKYCPGDKELEVPHVIVENNEDEDDIDDLQRMFYIGGATGFVIGFWMVCIALLANKGGRRAFFHFLNSLENWVYVKVMVFIAKISMT